MSAAIYLFNDFFLQSMIVDYMCARNKGIENRRKQKNVRNNS